MESSLKNMVVVLFTITLISSAAVGGVYMITKEPIEQAKVAAVNDALNQVLPEYEATTSQTIEVNSLPVVAHTATVADKAVGYAVESISKNGFGGTVRLMVGFDTAGKIININVLEQKETPGLGTKMTDEGNVLLASFKDKNASEINMTVKKDGGDIDALTAATISSRAYAEAVAVAYEAFKVACGWQTTAGDVATGASQQAEKGGNNE
ncbi:MAG: RnfABCDGE type electron transport complex subunit G [Alistipes sp.]|nr:RnfABCDGE type electron transport complex subunit G [Alistipes sp.]